MKRCSILLVCAVLMFGVLGVQLALAETPAGTHHQAGRPASATSSHPTGGLFAGLGASATRNLAFGGGTNIGSPVELPFCNLDDLSTAPSGTVSAVSHPHDVYWFFLEKGASIALHLDLATPGAHVALRLFDNSATDVDLSQPVLNDTSYSYPLDDEFTAPAAGYYFVDIDALSGASDYTLLYVWGHPNDDVPGVPIAASPIVNPLEYDWNWDDVYRVPLQAGDTLNLSAAPYPSTWNTSSFDIDLYLLGPSATSVYPWGPSNPALVASSANAGTGPEALSYRATSTGSYYVDVNDGAGDGFASLAWSVNPIRPKIARTPSASSLTYKRKKGVAKFTLSARFTNQFGLPLTSTTVYVQTSSNGKKWKNAYKGKTGADGVDAWTFSIKKKGKYYFRWSAPLGKGATSGTQKVTIK
jgi:hypothetical protein